LYKTALQAYSRNFFSSQILSLKLVFTRNHISFLTPMSGEHHFRADSPTLEPEELYPDSPTLAPESFFASPKSSSSSCSSSRSISPVFTLRPRNPRRGASVLEGVLWSTEGTRLIPKVEDLQRAYEQRYDRESLEKSATDTATATNDRGDLRDVSNVFIGTQEEASRETETEDRATPELFGLTKEEAPKDPEDRFTAEFNRINSASSENGANNAKLHILEKDRT
jgi:hypothetical protein